MLFTRAAFCVLFVSVVPTLADEETNLLTKLDCQVVFNQSITSSNVFFELKLLSDFLENFWLKAEFGIILNHLIDSIDSRLRRECLTTRAILNSGVLWMKTF